MPAPSTAREHQNTHWCSTALAKRRPAAGSGGSVVQAADARRGGHANGAAAGANACARRSGDERDERNAHSGDHLARRKQQRARHLLKALKARGPGLKNSSACAIAHDAGAILR